MLSTGRGVKALPSCSTRDVAGWEAGVKVAIALSAAFGRGVRAGEADGWSAACTPGMTDVLGKAAGTGSSVGTGACWGASNVAITGLGLADPGGGGSAWKQLGVS